MPRQKNNRNMPRNIFIAMLGMLSIALATPMTVFSAEPARYYTADGKAITPTNTDREALAHIQKMLQQFTLQVDTDYFLVTRCSEVGPVVTAKEVFQLAGPFQWKVYRVFDKPSVMPLDGLLFRDPNLKWGGLIAYIPRGVRRHIFEPNANGVGKPGKWTSGNWEFVDEDVNKGYENNASGFTIHGRDTYFVPRVRLASNTWEPQGFSLNGDPTGATACGGKPSREFLADLLNSDGVRDQPFASVKRYDPHTLPDQLIGKWSGTVKFEYGGANNQFELTLHTAPAGMPIGEFQYVDANGTKVCGGNVSVIGSGVQGSIYATLKETITHGRCVAGTQTMQIVNRTPYEAQHNIGSPENSKADWQYSASGRSGLQARLQRQENSGQIQEQSLKASRASDGSGAGLGSPASVATRPIANTPVAVVVQGAAKPVASNLTTQLIGQWKGAVGRGVLLQSITMQFNQGEVGEVIGKTVYTSESSCAGALTLRESGESAFVLEENMTKRTFLCPSGGTIKMHIQSPGTAYVEWTRDGKMTMKGTINRQ